MEAFSDGVFAVIITIMVLEMKSPRGTGLAALRPLLPVFCSYVLSFVYVGIYWNNHQGDTACRGWHPVGESAFVVLAVANPVRYRLDGGEPFCALAGGLIRGGVTVRWNRLLLSDEDTDRTPRKRLNAGSIDWQ
jgi:hypothetical protein